MFGHTVYYISHIMFLFFVWIVMQEYAKSKAAFGPNRQTVILCA